MLCIIRKIQMISLMIMANYLVACGVGTIEAGAGGGGDPNSDDQTAWLGGSWSGTFDLKDDDGASMAATATFKTTDERDGTFSIKLPANDGASITGEFQDFAGETLVLSIAKSNISALGSSNSKTTLDYNLIGNALKLQNDRAVLRLVRDKNGGRDNDNQNNDDSDDDDDDQTPDTAGIVGHWNCDDGKGRTWSIKIKSATSFSADVTAANSAPVWLDGTVTKTDGRNKYEAILIVTDSEIPQYDGLQFGFDQTEPNSATLFRLDQTSSTMTCART